MSDLALAVLAVVLSVPLALFSTGPPRIVLGLVVVLFLPGYALVAALFPRKTSLESVERIALGFGLSLAVVPLLGLALNYTPWGIRLHPILLTLTSFILAMVATAYWRRRRLPEGERFTVMPRAHLTAAVQAWRPQTGLDKLLTGLLVLSILGAAGALAYVVATPKVGEQFTEFYILGLDGKAEGYPGEVALGNDVRLRLGVVNHEQRAAGYRVVVTVGGQPVGQWGPLELRHEERWEEEISFQPLVAGEQQKVEFQLLEGDSGAVYRVLHLWLDVRAQ